MQNLQIYSNCPMLENVKIHILAYELCSVIDKFYKNPENQRRFEEWQQKRRQPTTTNQSAIF